MEHSRYIQHYEFMLRRLVIAIILGAAAALVVWLFHQALNGLEWLFLGHRTGSLVTAAGHLPGWRRMITPMLGGMAAGCVLWLYQRLQSQHSARPADYIEAVDTGDGQLDFAASLVKCLASLIVVACGSAIGREGAMILLAALFASLFAQKFTPPREWKLWVACGAAAGMASAYHAPLAGSLFIAEILFGTLHLAALAPVLVAAVSALLMSQLLTGNQDALYHVSIMMPPLPVHYLLMGLLGIIAGLSGPLFLYLLQSAGGFFRRLRLVPPLQLALGGLIVGLLSLFYPEVWGNGYSVVQLFLSLPPAGLLIAAILACKLFAVLASSGSGAPGGVFTPTLFVGAALGALCGQIAGVWPAAGEQTALLLTMAGMASFLAATTHAPIMAAVMVFEMTGEYTLLPGLLLACVLATIISRGLRAASVYQRK